LTAKNDAGELYVCEEFPLEGADFAPDVRQEIPAYVWKLLISIGKIKGEQAREAARSRVA
jgi:hypothetical protein